MEEKAVRRMVERILIKQMIETGAGYYVPAAISARHAHLCEKDIESLFGKGHILKKMRDLNQPGQYACEERLTLLGPKGSIHKIRVLGPARGATQVEISQTDCFAAGLPPVVRMSGDYSGTPGGTLVGPAGEVNLTQGVMVSARHLHLSEEEAGWFGLEAGDLVSAKCEGPRPVIFGNIAVRVGKGHSLELHIDTDEANAAAMTCGELFELIK